MRIAFCHNLKTSDSLEEAEFDTQDTVDRLARALRSGGHEVHLVNMNAGVSRAAGRLETLRPDLIFNTAEGRPGKLREALYPAIFEELRIPFTGADAHACALTLDKLATKERVAREGVPTARSFLVTARSRSRARAGLEELAFPVIAKPNFEGSSIGITAESVFQDRRALAAAIDRLLAEFPLGILVEEFITGRDVTIGFLEALEPPILDPTGYTYTGDGANHLNIYDYRLKNVASECVQVDADPRLEPALAARIREWAAAAALALDVRDVARFDFRIGRDGDAFFLEANALPSLEEGAGLLVAAEKRGLSFDDAILTIVESAARRHGLASGASRPRARRRRVGLTFNLKRSDTTLDDSEAEFDTPRTIEALRAALLQLGNDVVELEATRELPARLASSGVDLVFNVAEGVSGRNRESHVPSLCELLGIPCTGSDAATLSICLDKALAKRILRDSGVATPAFVVLETGGEPLPGGLRWPLIAKPIAEGTSKGLGEDSVVQDERALRSLAASLIEKYREPVIVEEYVSGRELTVGLVGWPVPRILEPLEVVFTRRDLKHPVYHYRLKQDFCDETRFECPARLSRKERGDLEAAARAAFEALGCRDVARIDFRVHSSGPKVIEVNPLPGLSPGFSDLCLIADGSGVSYLELIREILAGTLARHSITA